MNEYYLQQARLLVELMPHAAQEPAFAVKGGAAINLFVRDAPRISVDLDLTYLPLQAREESLDGIAAALRGIAWRVKRFMAGVEVREQQTDGRARVLHVSRGGVVVKLEPNTILRGTVLPPSLRTLSKEAERLLGAESRAVVATLAFEELYAGKICAALDRQHPRDLFDVHVLLRNEGITDGVRKAFVVYLAGHNRPMSELLEPVLSDLEAVQASDFLGMTNSTVSIEELLAARLSLVRQLHHDLTDSERRFLLSVKRGEPQWDLMPFSGLERLPALQWKLTNIRRMDPRRRAEAEERLRAVLGV